MKLKTFFKAIATLVIINKVVAQLSDLVTSSAVASGSMIAISSTYSLPKVVDKDGSSPFVATGQTRIQGNSIQVDLGTSQSIKSVYMLHWEPQALNDIELFVGDVAYSDASYASSNTLCHLGGDDGLVYCEGTGRYLIWTLALDSDQFKFYELSAFNAIPLGSISDGDFVISTDLTLTEGHLDKLLGETDSNIKCVDGDAPSGQFALTVSYLTPVQVEHIVIFSSWGGNTYTTSVTIQTVISDGSSVNCGTMTMNAANQNSISCATAEIAQEVMFVFTTGSAKFVKNLCNLGIFGKPCTELPQSISEDVYAGQGVTTIFDLLTETTKSISLPTLTKSPVGCVTTIWTVHLQSDATNMETAQPTVFSIFFDLTIAHTISDFSQRQSLFGASSYYFVGETLSIPTSTISSQFDFIIDFQDACRTSTITPKTLTFSPFKYQVTGSQTQAPFVDSIDDAGGHTIGICGEKIVTLAAGTPSFLTLTADVTDPLNNAMTLAFDSSLATESDMISHTIAYTVSSKEYPTIVPDITGTFTFTILCPDNVITSSLDTPIQATMTYDLTSGTTSQLSLPVVSVTPASCFTVDTFLVTDNVTGSAVSFVTQVTATHVDINSQDWSLKGEQTLNIQAVISNGQNIESHTFKVTFFDTCPTLIASLTESPFAGGTTNFGLLHETSKRIALPTVTVTPTGCNFPITWAIKRVSDGQDMTTFLPSVFSITATRVVLSHVVSDIAQRKSLFGLDTYNLIGTVGDSHSTQTSSFQIAIDFKDGCRQAAVTQQTIILTPSPIYRVDATKQYTINAFTDSVDVNNNFSIGTCGEKLVTLDAGFPAYLTLTPDSVDPIQNPMSLSYDDSQAIDSDVGQVKAIGYTVSFKDYSGITPDYSSTFNFEIDCPSSVVSSSITTPVAPGSKYDVANPEKLKISLPVISLVPSTCFQVKIMEVFLTANPLAVLDFITATSDSYEVKTDDRKNVAVQELTTVALISNGQRLEQHNFKVDIFDSCDSLLNTLFSPETAPIGTLQRQAKKDEALTQKFIQYDDQVSFDYQEPNLCGCKRYTLLQASSLQAAPQIISISYEECGTDFELIVDARTFEGATTYNLLLRVELINYPNLPPVDQPFKLQIDAPPTEFVFVPPEPKPDPKPEPKPPVIIVEDIVDPDINTDSDTSTEEVEDDEPKVKILSEQDNFANELRANVNTRQRSKQNPVPFIKSVDSLGNVIVGFTQPMQVINSEIDLSTLEFQYEPEVWQPVLNVYADPSEEQDPSKVGLTWNVTEYTSDKMTLKLFFDDALYISFEKADTLVIVFADEELFISEDGIKISEESRILKRKLVRQIPQDKLSVQKKINTQAQQSKTGSFMILMINLVSNMGLQEMFSTINALQVIIFIPLLDSSIPANAGMVFKKLTKIAAFDIFEIGDYVDEYFKLEPTDPVSEKFETIGMESLYFINNVGSFIFIIVMYILAIIAYLLMFSCGNASQTIKKLRKSLRDKIFWEGLMVMIFESFLIVVFCGLIMVKYKLSFETWGVQVQSIFGIFCFSWYLVAPIYGWIKVFVNFEKANDKKFRIRYGYIYEGLAVNRGRKVLAEPFIFLLRRLLIAYLIVYKYDTMIYQFMVVFCSQLLIVTCFYQFEFFETASYRRQQTLSEITILLVSHTFLIFNVVSVEQNFTLGYVTIGIIGIYLFVNFIIVIHKIIVETRRKYYYKKAKRYHNKQRKLLKAQLDETRARRRQLQQQKRDHANAQYWQEEAENADDLEEQKGQASSQSNSDGEDVSSSESSSDDQYSDSSLSSSDQSDSSEESDSIQVSHSKVSDSSDSNILSESSSKLKISSSSISKSSLDMILELREESTEDLKDQRHTFANKLIKGRDDQKLVSLSQSISGLLIDDGSRNQPSNKSKILLRSSFDESAQQYTRKPSKDDDDLRDMDSLLQQVDNNPLSRIGSLIQRKNTHLAGNLQQIIEEEPQQDKPNTRRENRDDDGDFERIDDNPAQKDINSFEMPLESMLEACEKFLIKKDDDEVDLFGMGGEETKRVVVDQSDQLEQPQFENANISPREQQSSLFTAQMGARVQSHQVAANQHQYQSQALRMARANLGLTARQPSQADMQKHRRRKPIQIRGQFNHDQD